MIDIRLKNIQLGVLVVRDANKVLIVASGLSALEFDPLIYKDWTLVAVNNGWQAIENSWHYWIRSSDYTGSRPVSILDWQTEVRRYGDSLRVYGGHHLCGYSITLCASYYVLDKLKPTEIGYLGADMNYEPVADGSTSIYGVGHDILKNNISDPDRMVNRYGGGDPEYITRVYNRFRSIAAEEGVLVRNHSRLENTRLPYAREY